MRYILRWEKSKNNTNEISKQCMTNSRPRLGGGERASRKLACVGKTLRKNAEGWVDLKGQKKGGKGGAKAPWATAEAKSRAPTQVHSLIDPSNQAYPIGRSRDLFYRMKFRGVKRPAQGHRAYRIRPYDRNWDMHDPKAWAHPVERISLVRAEFSIQPWARSTHGRKSRGQCQRVSFLSSHV